MVEQYSDIYNTPDEHVSGLGWVWDEENKYFKHPKSNQIFYSAYMNWDNKRWLVPLFCDHNEIDKVTSRTWKLELAGGGSSYSLKMNIGHDFKNSRRGKRYRNYLRYLKRRDRVKKSLTKKLTE